MNTDSRTGDDIVAPPTSWSFSGDVAGKFDTHVRKSIPLYEKTHEIGLWLSDFFVKQNSLVYDVGSSTGTFLRALSQRHSRKAVRYVGLDVIGEMVDYANSHTDDPKIEFICSDMLSHAMKPSSLISSYFTMQFVDPAMRQDYYDKVFKSLTWGGAFLLFEKVRGPDARFQDILSQVYEEHKIDQGYTHEEISSKRRSLKGVMEPFSTAGNLELLNRAGFKDVVTVFKYICFEGFLAIK